MWGIVATVLALVGVLAGVWWLEAKIPFPPASAWDWAILVGIGAPLYIACEILGDAASEAMHTDRRLVVRLIPVLLIILFYTAWYAVSP
jgi:hypothetical protein